MKYGYTAGNFTTGPLLLQSHVVTGDVFWRDKEGGSMIGRSEYGVHDTAIEAWSAAVSGTVFQADHSAEIAKRHAGFCAHLIRNKP